MASALWVTRWMVCTVLAAAVMSAAGCATGDSKPTAVAKHSLGPSTSTATSLNASSAANRAAGGYARSCSSYPAVCVEPASRRAAVPASLWRPMKFPSAANGCPVSHTHQEPKSFPFGRRGIRGQGPVVAWLESPPHAKTVKIWGPHMYDTPGLYGVKTLWISKSSYNGPILLRGKRLDATGQVVFGDGNQDGPHELTSVQIPPGGDSRIYEHGYRSWPGGTWVHAPGCYGIQADGTNFTSRFVVQLVK